MYCRAALAANSLGARNTTQSSTPLNLLSDNEPQLLLAGLAFLAEAHFPFAVLCPAQTQKGVAEKKARIPIARIGGDGSLEADRGGFG